MSVMSSIREKLGGLMGSGDDDPQRKQDQLADDASDYLTEKWDLLKSAYILYHQSVWEAILFYVGQTRIAWDNGRKIFYPDVPNDEWVPQPKINRYAPTIDAIATNFNDVPEVEAVPKTELNGDLKIHGIAEIATALGDHCFRENGLYGSFNGKDDRSGYAAQLFVLSGSIFTDVYPAEDGELNTPKNQPIDAFAARCNHCFQHYEEMDEPPEESGDSSCPECGEPLEVKPITRTRPMIGPDGQPVMQSTPKFKVCIDIVEPLYGFPRPGSKYMNDSDFFIVAERKSIDQIFWRDGYTASPDVEQPDGYNITLEHALNFFYTGYSNMALNSKDSAMRKRIYIEPRKVQKFPDGLYAVMVNGKITKSSIWADEFVVHPITFASYMQIPTLFFGRSVSFDLIEIQREKQDYESLIKLHTLTSASSSIVVDENTVVGEIQGRPDAIIKWRSIGPGSKEPHRLAAGNLDDGVYKMRQAFNDEFENISGAVSVFKGRQPGSITAGSAIADLKGQAEQMFSKPVQNWNSLWCETFRKVVLNCQARMSVAQIMQLVGPGRESAIMDFKSAQMDDIIDYLATQGQPRTQAQRKQELMLLFDHKALDINDPNVKQEVFELFGHTGMMKMFNADATRARYENKQMQSDTPVRVMPEIEDLAVHLFIHKQTAKSLEFEKWQPQTKMLLLQHIMETGQMLQQQMLGAATLQKGPAKGNAPSPAIPGGGPGAESHPTPPTGGPQ